MEEKRDNSYGADIHAFVKRHFPCLDGSKRQRALKVLLAVEGLSVADAQSLLGRCADSLAHQKIGWA